MQQEGFGVLKVATLPKYPSLLRNLPPRLTIHDGIPAGYFTVDNCHLVVALLLHDSDGGIYLIEPANAPRKTCRLIFPQEKVKWGTDNTIKDGILRGLREELGLPAKMVMLHPEELYRFENHLPLERTCGIYRTKTIIYFAAKVAKGVVFVPNHKEVREVVRVTDDEYLDCTCATARYHKCTAQNEAVTAALEAGLLNEEQWPSFWQEMAQAEGRRRVG